VVGGDLALGGFGGQTGVGSEKVRRKHAMLRGEGVLFELFGDAAPAKRRGSGGTGADQATPLRVSAAALHSFGCGAAAPAVAAATPGDKKRGRGTGAAASRGGGSDAARKGAKRVHPGPF